MGMWPFKKKKKRTAQVLPAEVEEAIAAIAQSDIPEPNLASEESPLLADRPPVQEQDIPDSFRDIQKRLRTPPGLYPLKGIMYLLSNPVLFAVIQPRVLPCILLSLGIVFVMFFFLYLPHVAVLSIYLGVAAFVQAALMILNESAVLISILCENFLLEESLVNMFDAVLLLENLEPLVQVGQEVDRSAPNVVAELGKFKKSPSLRPSFRVIFEFIVFFPVNFIPLVGPVLFLAIQGNRAGPISHYWYYRLKNWDKKTKDAFIKANHWNYISFGTVALGLQWIPIVSILISFTNAIGAALWAAYMEKLPLQAVLTIADGMAYV